MASSGCDGEGEDWGSPDGRVGVPAESQRRLQTPPSGGYHVAEIGHEALRSDQERYPLGLSRRDQKLHPNEKLRERRPPDHLLGLRIDNDGSDLAVGGKPHFIGREVMQKYPVLEHLSRPHLSGAVQLDSCLSRI